MLNSRAKGRRAELEVCRMLRPHYPDACPNLDQYGPLKQDILNVPFHLQVKRTEKLNVWAALDQTITEACPLDLPVLAFRRNWSQSSLPSRSTWFGALELEELIALLRMRDEWVKRWQASQQKPQPCCQSSLEVG